MDVYSTLLGSHQEGLATLRFESSSPACTLAPTVLPIGLHNMTRGKQYLRPHHTGKSHHGAVGILVFVVRMSVYVEQRACCYSIGARASGTSHSRVENIGDIRRAEE